MEVTADSIKKYGDYLISNGQKPEDVEKYKAYIAKESGINLSQPESSKPPVTVGGLYKGFKQSLPGIGGALGGGIAFAAGQMGPQVFTPEELTTVPAGIGLGTAAGKGLQNLLNTFDGSEQAPKNAYEAYVEPIKEGATSAALDVAVPKLVQKGLESGGYLLKKGAAEIGNFSTKAVDVFLKRADQVDDIIKKYGEEGINDAVPEFKKQMVEQINQARQVASRAVGKVIHGKIGERVANINEVKKLFTEKLKQINEVTDPSDWHQVNDMLQRVSKLSDESGNISIKNLHDLKAMFQGMAKGTYQKEGQITFTGTIAKKVANIAGKRSKVIFDKIAPEAKVLNDKLHKIYKIEKTIPRSVFAESQSPARLMSIASGSSPAQAKQLGQLGEMIGRPNIVGEAENIYSATKMANAPLISGWGTGRANYMPLVGGALGGAYNFDQSNPLLSVGEGMLYGGVLGSPKMLRYGLRGASSLGRRFPNAGRYLIDTSRMGSQVGRGLLDSYLEE